MSHLTATAPASQAPLRASAAGTHGLTFVGVLRSEWIKFWSLMSTKLLLVISFVAMIGLSTFGAWGNAYGMSEMGKNPGRFGPTAAQLPDPNSIMGSVATVGQYLGVPVIGALAVMFIASEYSTGMIRSSFAAVPGRLPVFWAKAIILVVISYVLSVVAFFASFALDAAIFKAYGFDVSLSGKGTLSTIFLTGVYVAGAVLLGLALGALLRNSAGAIVILVGLIFVLPIAGNFLGLIPGDFWKYLPDYFPSEAGARMATALDHTNGKLDAWQGGLVYLGWILLAAIPALVLLKKRDV
ncbi:ABC transporter permease [Psychromicrobium xiongbiense]|uniref:ABC transporter permease n=1 Tax=Psychromicrobium xiongbiense TaxID=3051184 RepID=UPI0025531C7D|nr:ABC transporter permease [Psychromicrobium sp. YIM S02556]